MARHLAQTVHSAALILLFHQGAIAADPPASATPPSALTVLQGFKVELLRSATPTEGSWIAMTFDPKGRLLVSPQEGVSNLLRITLTPNGQVGEVERLPLPVGSAMGLLCALDSLYVSGLGPDGLWLYRVRDMDGDATYDRVEKLRRFEGAGGEHGSHALRVGPDGKLYQVHGNFVRVPTDVSGRSPLRNYAEDLLLPRAEDGNGFGAGLKPPAGFVTRMDPDGSNVELFAGGFRNTYDIAFNPEGELFGFDSDMEWDWGAPWYRPTRFHHIVSGGDYGFREGTGKWPNYFPDGLPTTLDIGIGSPTGLEFGTRAAFPDRYRRALFALDWSYGRVLAVHLQPQGSTYSGTFENLVSPRSLREPVPKATLPLTDLEIGPDGALYFITGGRSTQSGLYRVTYEGPREDPPVPTEAQRLAKHEGAAARRLRHQLESFHGRTDPRAIDEAWAHLANPDRWIRYAARLAIESQPVEMWQERALAEADPRASLTALLALARCGGRAVQGPVYDRWHRLIRNALTEDQQLDALRILHLAWVRLGPPDPAHHATLLATLTARFPSQSDPVNRELVQVLIALDAPEVTERALALVGKAGTLEEQLHYVFHLRYHRSGWTRDLRRKYFAWFRQERASTAHPAQLLKWFAEAGRRYEDGASLPKFLDNLRRQAAANLPEEERVALADVIGPLVKSAIDTANLSTRAFVRDWKLSDIVPSLERVSAGRSFDRGRRAFLDAQCNACHRFAGEGGAVGPELTAVASKYTRREILESILEPSRVVSEQFQNHLFYLKDGDEEIGRVLAEDDSKVVIQTDPLRPESRMELLRTNINAREASRVSPMPEGTTSLLTLDDILDLLAYLESGGDSQYAAFRPGGDSE